jgi:hypothetical protein
VDYGQVVKSYEADQITHGQMFRFPFPGKQKRRLGLEPGDKATIRIDSIKKQVLTIS